MRIVVLGAGLIGTYVGASLHAAGADVTLIGRARMRKQVEDAPLVLSDLGGGSTSLPASSLDYRESPDALAGAELVIVSVKSGYTAEAAALIPPGARTILSLQNGLTNAEVLRAARPDADVVAGMVPFNVAMPSPGRLHRATEGELMAARTAALDPWLDTFAKARLPITLHADFEAVQWGKLLFNLNNAVNALAGIPLRAELSQRAYRRSYGLLVAEALAVLKKAGIKPAKVSKVPPRALPLLLGVPDALFTRAAGAMLRIDQEARSSMWDDLAAGRRTEVDHLNGAVVALAARVGGAAPANREIVDLVHEAETGPHTPLSGPDLYARLSAARTV